jgi:tripartite-type tricarboxylate transporter receptor subunit TctC
MQDGTRIIAALAAFICMTLVSSSHAADEARWPARTIRIVVGQAPGGPPDLIARFVAEPLERALGVPVVVENRPGATGIIGLTAAARAAPDGYTLAIGTQSTHALVPHANANVTYDPLRDFVPVANLFRSIKVLWINPALPARTLRDWSDYASARPGSLNYASGGVGSSNHIDMEVVNTALQLDAVHVPYNGPSAAIAAVASGDAHAMIVSVGTGLPLAKGGRVRPIAIFSGRRAPQLPDVPTAAEQNFAGVDLSAWIGLFAPARTPAVIVERLNIELTKILRSPEAIAWADSQGMEIVGGSADAFAATLAADHARWGDVIRRLRLKSE